MTEHIFLRWRLALTALFLGAEGFLLTARPLSLFSALPTLLLAPAVLFPARGLKRWLLTYLPALWLLVCCVLRLAGHISTYALPALSPALCGGAFLLACLQLTHHGRETLYQWSAPTAWLFGLGVLLCLLLGRPEADSLWFLLLLTIAELGRCAALIDLLK